MRNDPAAPPYRAMLRVVGRCLDELSARGANMIETRDGVAIRYYRGADPRITERKYLSYVELNRMDAEQRKERRSRLRIPKRSSRTELSESYTDFLRALGGEIDGREGGGIALEELQDGMYLSYQYQDPLTALHFRVTSMTLSLIQCREALSDARGSRNASPPRWNPRDN